MGMRISKELEAQLMANALPGTLVNGKPWPPPVEPISPASEAEFMAEVVALAKRLLWDCFHPFDSRRSKSGFPDLTLWRERVIFAELKTEIGQTTASQDGVIEGLKKAGAEVYLWRPIDFPDIAKVLK